MNGIDIIETLNDIDEWMIQDAKQHRKVAPVWLRWGSVAVCLCCLMLIGGLSIHWLTDPVEVPAPLPDAMASAAESEVVPTVEPTPDITVTLSSSKYPVTLTIPTEYRDYILIDTPFDYSRTKYYDEDSADRNYGDTVFSLYVEQDKADAQHGFVWAIEVVPKADYEGASSFDDVFQSEYVFNYSLLGSDDTYSYLLMHCGEPSFECYDNSSISSTETYLNFAQDSVAMIGKFLLENEITEDPQWLQRFTEFTLLDAEENLEELMRFDNLDSDDPLFWEYTGPYDLETCIEFSEDEKTMTFFDPVTRDIFGDGIGGKIWWIDILTKEEFADRIAGDAVAETRDGVWYGRMDPCGFMYATGTETVYVLNAPTDLQYDPVNPDSNASYLKYMNAGLNILESIISLNGLTVNPSWNEEEVKFMFQDLFPEDEALLYSIAYPARLTVPKEYEDHVFVDSSFYYDYNSSRYGIEGEDMPVLEGSTLFSFYTDFNETDQLYGLVWFITGESRYDYVDAYDYGEVSDLVQVLNYTVLGSDDDYTYVLHHPGYPNFDAYRFGSLEEAVEYYAYVQEGIAMLEGFIGENNLIPEPQWKNRYAKLTVQAVEEDVKSLQAKKTSGEYLDISDYPYTLSNFVSQLTVDEERNSNIALACEALDGTLLEPGETFSFNEVVGERTAEKGYKEAFVYSSGDGERAMGGGVSQVASTLYYTCLYADLEILERHGYTYRDGTFPAGMDAAVEWNGKDFSFMNTYDAPIYISASASGSSVMVKLLTTEEPDFSVKVGSVCAESVPYETQIVEGSGENQNGINGGTYTIVRYVYDNEGNLIRTDTTEDLDAMGGLGTTVYEKRDEIIYK